MPVPIESLVDLPLLNGLNSTELEEMASCLDLVEEGAGKRLIKEGDPPGNPLFFLLRGSVEVLKSGLDGKGHVISCLASPSVFGEMELLTKRSAIASVLTATNVQLATLGRGVFNEMLAANRQCVLKLVARLAYVLSHRLAAADERIAAGFNLREVVAEEKVRDVQRALYSGWPGSDEGS